LGQAMKRSNCSIPINGPLMKVTITSYCRDAN